MEDIEILPHEYVDIRKVLSNTYWFRGKSKNYKYYFIVTERGIGKTYSAKLYICNKFIKSLSDFRQGKRVTPSRFIYLRRRKSEFKKLEKFFDSLNSNQEYPGYHFYVKGTNFYCERHGVTYIMGYAFTLSTSSNIKGEEYHDVDTILYEEYQIDPKLSSVGYLRGEETRFLDICNTVIRRRQNVKVIILGNNISMINPLNNHFGFNSPPQPNKLLKNIPDKACFIFVEDLKLREKIMILDGVDGKKLNKYEQYAYENKVMNDNEIFIGKRPSTAFCKFILTYRTKKYGVWLDPNNSGLIYLSDKYDKSCKFDFALMKSDHTPNTMLIQSNNAFLKILKDNYKLGNIRFESQLIKKDGEEIMQWLNLR